MPEDERPLPPPALTVLGGGTVEIRGRMPWSSNATFLARVVCGESELNAVYKPGRGERPLWDFPDGLYRREAAAWVLSEALGWGVVPETIVRIDAPYGPGSLQRFVDADFEQHYFTLLDDEQHWPALMTIAAFDLLANNADRKSGHCLLAEGRIWGIDQGLCFHEAPKLRTVMWDFAGADIPEALVDDIRRVSGDFPPGLSDLLHPGEVAALSRRMDKVARHPIYPHPSGHHHDYPWPMV